MYFVASAKMKIEFVGNLRNDELVTHKNVKALTRPLHMPNIYATDRSKPNHQQICCTYIHLHEIITGFFLPRGRQPMFPMPNLVFESADYLLNSHKIIPLGKKNIQLKFRYQNQLWNCPEVGMKTTFEQTQRWSLKHVCVQKKGKIVYILLSMKGTKIIP